VTAVPGGRGGVLDGDVVPGQARELPVGGRLVALDHGDVVGVLGLDEPGDVRLDRVQGVEGDQGAVQVQGLEQGPEVRGLVRLRPDLCPGEGQGLGWWVTAESRCLRPADRRADPLSALPSTAITCRCPGAAVLVFRLVR
jgi:hypothetical protein